MGGNGVLMVAEKPILAESIAKILSDGRCHTRKGWNRACSVSEWSGHFEGRPVNFKMTSTCGHVMSVDFPGRYNNWDRVDPQELFTCPTEKKEANPAMKMEAYLASEARNCTRLVLWLDCDKEGENICFEVINAVRATMIGESHLTQGDFMEHVYRARFSAISDRDIKQAMAKLARPNLNESLSVDARQELDLRIGCSFTRFQTRYFQDKYGDLDSTCISFGPCQTPTLAFCVTRHDQIVQFKPEPYWLLAVEIEDGKVRRDAASAARRPPVQTLRLEHARERIFDKDVAQLFLNRVRKASEEGAMVVDITEKEGKREKPLALNTVELLKVASSALGMSPTQCMSCAEHLYTRGYISYPRTETTAYPKGFDPSPVVQQLARDGGAGGRCVDVARQIIREGWAQPRHGEDKGDHPPITPMRAGGSELSGDQARLYDYVAAHFLATLMKPCKYATRTVKFTIGGEIFTAKSRRVIDPGFTAVMSWRQVASANDDDADTEDDPKEEVASTLLDSLQRGACLPVREARLVERETSPPGYLTEAELIALMERYGIGTDASIPVHINNICLRNYVRVETGGGGRRLVPTKLGIALIHGYWRVDPELVQPTMRADVECQLELIAKGKADYRAVLAHSLEGFKRKFAYFTANVGDVDSLFQASFTSLADSGKPFSRCGKCRRYMKLVETRPQRLYCPICEETYGLPSLNGGSLRPVDGEKACPLDEFGLLYLAGIGGKLAKSYELCPYCFNNPPFEGMRKGAGCNECTHPTCPHSVKTQGVMTCLSDECKDGTLVLDPQSGPKWRLACNRCSSVVGIFEGASRVKVLTHECGDCGALKLSAEYRSEKDSKLPEKSLSYKGCAFCDKDALGDDCVNLNHARIKGEMRFGGGRGRGRGMRGRGGRGRGRGRGSSRGGRPGR